MNDEMQLEYMDERVTTFKRYTRKPAKDRGPVAAMVFRFHNQSRKNKNMPPSQPPPEFQVIVGQGPLPVTVRGSDPGVKLVVTNVEFDDETLFTAELSADGDAINFIDQGKAGTAKVTVTGEYQWEGFTQTIEGQLTLVATDPIPEIDMTFEAGKQSGPQTPPAEPPPAEPPPPAGPLPPPPAPAQRAGPGRPPAAPPPPTATPGRGPRR
jgi:hypothetical protein